MAFLDEVIPAAYGDETEENGEFLLLGLEPRPYEVEVVASFRHEDPTRSFDLAVEAIATLGKLMGDEVRTDGRGVARFESLAPSALLLPRVDFP